MKSLKLSSLLFLSFFTMNANDKLETYYQNYILENYSEQIQSSISKTKNQRGTIHISYVINKNGTPFKEGVVIQAGKINEIENGLLEAVLNNPYQTAKKNNAGYNVLSYFQITFKISISDNKLVINKLNEDLEDPQEFKTGNKLIFPRYKGCEYDNLRLSKKCMEIAFQKILQKKMNLNKAIKGLGNEGAVWNYIRFNIDKKGKIVDVKIFAHTKNLEKQMSKAFTKVEDCQPATVNDKPISVPFVLPMKLVLLD